ncbi:rod shape-determining protein MreC [Sporolactobacillus shoreae]|uniref:Cell shape-determining protein MreC n=1 Tax=Sporolactobacillus shoreae TaxID=1465501 RepID=A0A4Z0GS58_9BACL|nr:rod shape-determining protein MreC [Sporolactobacillus shoreae]TGA99485.1 rod shape-determining protein MreC [Sporolactobacillus shoreae]
MPSFFSNKKLILLLTSLIVLIALISYSLRQGNRSSWPEQFAQDSVGLFQYVLNVPAQYAAGFFQNVSDIKNAYEENKKLKANLENYARVEQQNRDLSARYNQMRRLLNIEKDPNLLSYKKYAAEVISRAPDQWNQLMTVDKGSVNGIKTGMPVVTADGLVGTISQVGNFSSKVSLISNQQNVNQISAIIQNTRTYGMIEGYDPNRGTLLFQKIPIKANLKKGQIVTTSGLSGMYPPGLMIGTITSVSTDPYGLTQAAEVKPSANLNDIIYVMIIDKSAAATGTGG